ncbi:hypothetical protein AAC387_Pa07g2271 [Persea americana]
MASNKDESICEKTKKIMKNLITLPSQTRAQLQLKTVSKPPTSSNRGPKTSSVKPGEARLPSPVPGSHQLKELNHEPKPTTHVMIDIVIEGKDSRSEMISDVNQRATIFIREKRESFKS